MIQTNLFQKKSFSRDALIMGCYLINALHCEHLKAKLGEKYNYNFSIKLLDVTFITNVGEWKPKSR